MGLRLCMDAFIYTPDLSWCQQDVSGFTYLLRCLQIPSSRTTSPFVHMNISHDSGMVCFVVSEYLIGVDVMKVEVRGKRSIRQFFEVLYNQLHLDEWNFVYGSTLEEGAGD